MTGASLSDKQKQLLRELVQLCEVSQHRSFRYTPAFNNHNTIEAKGANKKISGGERDLRTLEHEGYLTLKWVRHGAAEGSVGQSAFDAVRENFGLPPEEAPAPAAYGNGGHSAATYLRTGAAGTSGAVAATFSAAGAAGGGDVAALLTGLLADVVATLKAALPSDEAEAAEADATAITRQFRAPRPDVEIVARRTQSLVTRVGAAAGSAAELATKGGKLGEALQKLGQLVSLTAHWATANRGRAA